MGGDAVGEVFEYVAHFDSENAFGNERFRVTPDHADAEDSTASRLRDQFGEAVGSVEAERAS